MTIWRHRDSIINSEESKLWVFVHLTSCLLLTLFLGNESTPWNWEMDIILKSVICIDLQALPEISFLFIHGELGLNVLRVNVMLGV